MFHKIEHRTSTTGTARPVGGDPRRRSSRSAASQLEDLRRGIGSLFQPLRPSGGSFA